ncbi:LysM peptidoglycan-binding domain-containing protein [Marinimicrobium sp. ABcell2]|uniref:lytic transglycosylase n=1 Tax=Marinimicrobium sp. ABcell2 TaxID=3069751 RepID=UPI0027AFFD75|nr:LysM peptidoglycan-binding domain-containing protein [Marinimicrobium sp. ABcell2]MDQ2075703.1 LysM peptidoglycan-binding domain-containing protein [Marinimicrobium sp. ABcell2]
MSQPNDSFALPSSARINIADEYCHFDPETHGDYEIADLGNLWPRLRAGYGFPEADNERIQTYVDWYKRHPHYIDRVVERGSRYLYHIVNELEARDMPLELALLPIIESAFDPFAYSHSRASGIWQFVPATGRYYGLDQNWWYDGRRDVVASTDAALTYLSRLHARFDNDWFLALAAYNTGGGNLNRSIRRNTREGRPTDYWSLRLPRETRNYVPQLIALARVIGDPEAHGITLQPVPDEPYFAEIMVDSQIDLAQAAEMAGIDIDELYLLNAGYNRWATDPEGTHRLLIPVQNAGQFTQRLAELSPEQRVSWTRYQVRSGDSLSTIARRHRTSVGTLQSVNDLNGHIIRVGQTLMIPTATQPDEHYAYSAGQRLERQQNRARGADGSQRIEYTVRSGDSFWRIARQHGVTVGALTNWNGMAPGDRLMPGQKLVVWTRNQAVASASAEQSPAFNNRSTVRRVNYRVRQGDSIARIANRFNVSVSDVLSWNQVPENSYIHPGQSLTLFVDVTGN